MRGRSIMRAVVIGGKIVALPMLAGLALPPGSVAGGVPGGAAGGDLGGTFPSPSVEAWEGVVMGEVAPTVGQVPTATGAATATWQTPAPAGASVATLLITSAQLLALHTTPQQIVAAPGAGQAVIPIALFWAFIQNTINYVDHGGSLQLQTANGLTIYNTPLAGAGFYDQGVSVIDGQAIAQPGIQISSHVNNQALQINLTVANPTTGNGTLAVAVAYMLAQVA